jgi:phosphoesterase RecJ-like protein
MTQSSFDEIGAVLRSQQTFAILSHVRPDGDALGSQLGLALSLSKLGKTIMVRNEDGLLEKYGFLPGGEFLQTPLSEPQDFDVAIALDTATQVRLGTATALVRSAKTWINIDHHPSNPGYGDLVYIDSNAPATGQILFELITSQGLPMDAAIAENLFVAISTDTGSFQYPNTTARTFEIGAELLKPASLRKLSAPPRGVAPRTARNHALLRTRKSGLLQPEFKNRGGIACEAGG